MCKRQHCFTVYKKNALSIMLVMIMILSSVFGIGIFNSTTVYAYDQIAGDNIYYVASEVTSTNWGLAANIGTPCTVGTAMANATAGDTVYFLPGTYNTTPLEGSIAEYRACWEPQNTGTAESPITFAAYPGEEVVINGVVPDGTDMIRVFSTGNKDYIIFDGFTIQANDGAKMGSIIIGYNSSWDDSSDGCIIRNCTFDGGSTIITSNENRECVCLQYTQNTVVERCVISNAKHTGIENINISAIKLLYNKHALIQDCEIFDCSVAIGDRYIGEFSTFKDNYIHNCTIGISVYNSGTNNNHPDMTIANNVFSFIGQRCISEGVDGNNNVGSDRTSIHNNTFYSGTDRISCSIVLNAGEEKEFYNNIIYGKKRDNDLGLLRFLRKYSASAKPVTIAVCNYNQYGDLPNNFFIRVSKYNGTTGSSSDYSSLTAWQNSGELIGGGNPDVNSLAGNPLFTNSSGTMNSLEDFRLAAGSPCIAAGSGGSNMGADIDSINLLSGLDESLYTVSFDSNGGSTVDSASVISGELFTEPADPTRDDYKFAGWYTDNSFTTLWDFSTNIVTGNITLYAKWDAVGKVHYVNPLTTSTDWNAAVNKNTPCTVDTAMANAIAGDTVYFLEGTYTTTSLEGADMSHYHARWEPQHSGTAENPITFAAYPGAEVIINGYSEGAITNVYTSPCMVRVFSTGTKDYIIFDGFKIQANDGAKMGSIIIGYNISNWANTSDGCIVRNCTFYGNYLILTSDNREAIRIEWAQNTLVQNCLIKDCRQVDNWHNISGIKMYHTKNTIIENCEIYNCSSGIFDKSDGESTIIRNNYIHNCYTGINVYNFHNGANRSEHPDMTIYNNVIAFVYRSITEDTVGAPATQPGVGSDRLAVYNNTIYTGNQKTVTIDIDAGVEQKFYNNIMYGLKVDGYEGLIQFDRRTEANGKPITIAVCDYNQYGGITGNFQIRIKKVIDSVATWSDYTDLSTWQASGELIGGGNPDLHSFDSNPKFLNSSGTMTDLNDFRLAWNSPCIGKGSDGNNMGADINLVGIKTGVAVNYCTVEFNSNGGSAVSGLVLESGSLVPEPSNPVFSNSEFIGWFKDSDCKIAWDFSKDTVTSNTILYAKWDFMLNPVTGISLDCADYSLRTAGTRQTLTTAKYSDSVALPLTEGVTYTSGNESIASVDSRGIITAVAEGQTYISAEYEGHQTQAGVFVLPPEPDGTDELVVKETNFSQADYLFSDDFETNRLGSYYDYVNIWGRFNRITGGIGNSYGMQSLHGYYTGDAAGHPNPYGTWLKLAVGKTTDNAVYKPVGDSGTVERELYWRFYVKNYTKTQTGTLGTSPIAQINGYGSNSTGVRTPFMSVNVYYPDDESGVLVSELKTGVFDVGNKPVGTADGPTIRGSMPVMNREFANQWHIVQIHVKLNDVGKSDGQYHLWVDGQLQASSENLDWTGDYTEYGINDLVIYNTNQQPGVPKGDNEYRMFDNMMVSRTKIGEAGVVTSNNADLLSISSSTGKKTPDKFNAAVLEYTVEVEQGTDNLQLTAQTSHPDSTIKAGGISYDSGELIPVLLQNGTATVAIEVTAPDGVTKKTYVIHVVSRKPYLVNEAENTKADWIFCDDFEENRMDQYFERTNDEQFYRSEGVGLGGSTGMKAEYRVSDGADYETGSLHLAFGRTPSSYFRSVGAQGEDLREVYVRFYVKNEKGWKSMGGHKLARLSAFQSPQRAQSMAAHIWTEETNTSNLYASAASGTDEAGALKSTKWNDFSNLRWIGLEEADIPIFDEDHVGEWYAVETHVKLNDPGLTNGVFELWIDDNLQVSMNTLNWTGAYEIGEGKGYGINWFGLENYCNNAVLKDQARYFDNLVISRSKIGLAQIESTGADKEALSAAITAEIGGDHQNPVYTLTASDYTVESWNVYTAAVNAAVNVEGDENATQEAVDTAIAAMVSAKEGLEFIVMTTPKATLTGPDMVSGQFTLTYGLQGAVNVTAQDVTISYDKERFTYISAGLACSGLTFVEQPTHNADAGTVRFLLTSMGGQNAVNGNAAILNMVFSPKTSGTGTVAVTNAILANREGDFFSSEITGATKTIQKSDNTSLAMVIQTAQGIYNSAVEGILTGQYPAGTKERFENKINAAIGVRDNMNATPAQVLQAIEDLNAAVTEFQSLIITASTGDINKKAGIDLGDLGLIATHYGMTKGNPGWDEVKHEDINGDGEIGLYELAFIAGRYLSH